VGGEIVFDEMYAGNPLVNVLCLGIARKEDIVKGAAKGSGNPVYYVGAKTGRDGIHGATMASAEFDEKSAEKRPAVQVGDPFMEKLLMEACLEVMKTGAVIGIQDMGAAGFTCSTSEMGSRGGVGMNVDVAHVPQRETGMIPYEIMLSESQERMLLVVERGREHEVEEVFEKWDLHAVKVGDVTEGSRLKIHERGALVGDVPNRALTDEAPVYQRPMREPAWQKEVQRLSLAELGQPPSAQAAFDRLIASPTIASKRWAYRQYDHTVGTNTIAQPGMSAAVVRVKGTKRGLAISVDGNGRFCYLDPYSGAMLAVAEAARNVACAGGEPIGGTNNLNFGNPERPEIMWQFGEAVRGIGDACRALNVPITGGNVSLYNETEGRAIYPTPVLGVVGLLEDASRTTTRLFKRDGAAIILLGDNRGELGGSEYLSVMHGKVAGTPPAIDLKREAALQSLVVKLIRDTVVESAHDCSEGGLAVAIAECTFDTNGGIGAVVNVAHADIAPGYAANATLFGESASRIVVSAARERVDAVLAAAAAAEVPAVEIGTTGGDRIQISVDNTRVIDCMVAAAEDAWATAIEKKMGHR
jgi:phosphoribosylformylglycinamidine synthase